MSESSKFRFENSLKKGKITQILKNLPQNQACENFTKFTFIGAAYNFLV